MPRGKVGRTRGLRKAKWGTLQRETVTAMVTVMVTKTVMFVQRRRRGLAWGSGGAGRKKRARTPPDMDRCFLEEGICVARMSVGEEMGAGRSLFSGVYVLGDDGSICNVVVAYSAIGASHADHGRKRCPPSTLHRAQSIVGV